MIAVSLLGEYWPNQVKTAEPERSLESGRMWILSLFNFTAEIKEKPVVLESEKAIIESMSAALNTYCVSLDCD